MLTAPQVRPAATVAATNLVTSLPMVFSTLLFGGIQTTVPVAVRPVWGTGLDPHHIIGLHKFALHKLAKAEGVANSPPVTPAGSWTALAEAEGFEPSMGL